MLCALQFTVKVVELLPQTVQTFGGRTFVIEVSRMSKIYFTVILSSQEEIPWIDPQMQLPLSSVLPYIMLLQL
jgi:hypothetical protein